MRLENRVAIVTGSARGLGKAIITAMAAEGAKVVVTDINYEACLVAKQEIEAAGGTAIAVKCDVTNREDVQKLMEETVKEFGKIDILVNNAGITKDASFAKMTDEKWDAVINVNLKSIFICTQEASKYMIANGYGRVISLSSLAGVAGNFGQTNYSATKAGIIGMTKTLAKELGRKGITVNAIAPGFINTEMTKTIPEDVVAKMMNNIPVKRKGEPREVAAAAVYLASEDAGFVTGETININGGEYMQ